MGRRALHQYFDGTLARFISLRTISLVQPWRGIWILCEDWVSSSYRRRIYFGSPLAFPACLTGGSANNRRLCTKPPEGVFNARWWNRRSPAPLVNNNAGPYVFQPVTIIPVGVVAQEDKSVGHHLWFSPQGRLRRP